MQFLERSQYIDILRYFFLSNSTCAQHMTIDQFNSISIIAYVYTSV